MSEQQCPSEPSLLLTESPAETVPSINVEPSAEQHQPAPLAETPLTSPFPTSTASPSLYTANIPAPAYTAKKSYDKNEVCREYLRGNCFRIFCKFQHPPASSLTSSALSPPGSPRNAMVLRGGTTIAQFCHDFQNRGCQRHNCRFTHGTRQEEDEYRRTGYLPPHLLAVQFGDPSVAYCRDFMTSKCVFPACKYRHLTQAELEMESINLAGAASSNDGSMYGDTSQGAYSSYMLSYTSPGMGDSMYGEDAYASDCRMDIGDQQHLHNHHAAHLAGLRVQNDELRHELNKMQMQLDDLLCHNGRLHDVNHSLRMQIQSFTASNGSTTASPNSPSDSASEVQDSRSMGDYMSGGRENTTNEQLQNLQSRAHNFMTSIQ